jgi:ferrous iron transport protein B
LQPLFTPLGFGSQLNESGWVFIVAAITGLIAKEEVIATFGTLAAVFVGVTAPELAAEGATNVMVMALGTGITWQALVAFIVFNMTTIPCFAAVAAAKGEVGKGKFKWTLLFWVVTSYIASSICYTVLSWWWTAFIWLAVAGAVAVGIITYNKKQTKN